MQIDVKNNEDKYFISFTNGEKTEGIILENLDKITEEQLKFFVENLIIGYNLVK